MTPQDVKQTLHHLQSRTGAIVFGSEANVRFAFIAYLVRGHLLLEGVPGVGKTLLARTFARTMGLDLRRVQCTPDLMPGDVIGANVFDFRTQTFTLTKGPVFTEFLLVDEVNRTPPKTQSALLEAMQERSVTIDGTRHALSGRFMVMATQNPVEHEGTYPLPEAQLDRFLFKLNIDYPAPEEELKAVLAHSGTGALPDLNASWLSPPWDAAYLDELHHIPTQIRLEPDIAKYCVALAQATRKHPSIEVGLSTRAATMLAAAAQANAACDGRDYVLPDDVKALFLAAAQHRIALSASAEMEDVQVQAVLREVLGHVAAPR